MINGRNIGLTPHKVTTVGLTFGVKALKMIE